MLDPIKNLTMQYRAWRTRLGACVGNTVPGIRKNSILISSTQRSIGRWLCCNIHIMGDAGIWGHIYCNWRSCPHFNFWLSSISHLSTRQVIKRVVQSGKLKCVQKIFCEMLLYKTELITEYRLYSRENKPQNFVGYQEKWI